MKRTKAEYKSTMIKIGAILLIFVGLLEIFMSFYGIVASSLEIFLSEKTAAVISSLLYDVAYLAAFMLPAIFGKVFFKNKGMQSMKLQPKLTFDTFAFIFAGVACVYAFSFINSAMVEIIFGSYSPEEMFKYAPVYSEDYSVILQFITIALVPAFCEEFLFRGIILSNLAPYGKSTAIVISSVCFGLMHSNFQQFLYATVAGIILGLVYVITDSIWASTIIHMINNAMSILQLVIFERMEEEHAVLLWVTIDCLTIVLGIISAVYLLKKYRSKPKEEPKGLFQKPLARSYQNIDSAFCGSSALDAKDAVRSFFCPTIIIFVVYSIFGAVARLFVI